MLEPDLRSPPYALAQGPDQYGRCAVPTAYRAGVTWRVTERGQALAVAAHRPDTAVRVRRTFTCTAYQSPVRHAHCIHAGRSWRLDRFRIGFPGCSHRTSFRSSGLLVAGGLVVRNARASGRPTSWNGRTGWSGVRTDQVVPRTPWSVSRDVVLLLLLVNALLAL